MRILNRSKKELAHRLRQELANLAMSARPPRLPASVEFKTPLPGLPNPSEVAGRLRGTAFAEDLRRRAAEILAHRMPLFDASIDAGPEIHWRRDEWSGKETSLVYFRRIPYLNAAAAGDHKVIWEINRHQHLVLLAQAALLEDSDALLQEVWRQLESWIAANPFHRGINWASALEVAFRALSWTWIFHLAGDRMPSGLRPRFFEGLYRHGRHLAVNLSFYFSPNTHLLGEAVALHALGLLFPQFPHARRWKELGRRTVEEQMKRQVRSDGGHFEQSTYYHVYALDMFLFHAILSPPSDEYRDGLARMADYLNAVMGPSRRLPSIGDDDGGRFFYPFGPRDQYGRASLAACSTFLGRSDWTYEAEDLYPIASWWLRAAEGGVRCAWKSRFFADTGIAVMISGFHHVVMDAGPFGPWSAGHSHSDTLSVVARSGDEEILIDPGTFTYTGDTSWRDRFRGSAFHNTIRIDGANQAKASGPFGWKDLPQTRVHSWTSTAEYDELDAEVRFRGFLHRRRVRFLKSGELQIFDDVEGPPGEHEIEQWWHLGSEAARSRLVAQDLVEIPEGWRSPVFGRKVRAPVLCVRRRTTLPCRLVASVALDRDPRRALANVE